MSNRTSLWNNRFLVDWVMILGLVTWPAVADAEWNWANPTPHGNTLRSAAHCAGGWVAVGDYGMVYTSPDGVQWQEQESGTTAALNGVACNDTTIVVVGEGGTVATSTDGIGWTLGNVGSDLDLHDAVWDPPDGGGYPGAFIAVGHQFQILASTDGVTWTEKNAPSGDIAEDLWGVAVNGDGSLLVATGGNCYEQCEVSTMMVSDDHGDTWTTTTHTGVEYVGITHGVTWGSPTSRGPLFVAAHEDHTVLTSPDGLSWTPQTTGTVLPLDVAWDGTQFVACGYLGGVVTSPDAITWTPQTSNTDLKLVAVEAGDGLLVSNGIAGTLITSGDGAAWTDGMAPEGRADLYFTDVAWSGVLAVAIDFYGSSTYGTSPDGWSWTFRDDTSGPGPSPARAITWAPVGETGLFVSVGHAGRIVTSPDGLTWTEQVSGVSTILRGVGSDGANLFVVGGSGIILTSSDGVTWIQEISNTSSTMYSVACGGTTCVAAGDILVARAGGVWTEILIDEDFWAVAHNGATYAAVGFEGCIFTSPDGVTWTSRVSGIDTSLYDVEVVNGGFIAVGIEGVILTSPDGITWTRETSGTTNLLRGASSGKGLAVGRDGTILDRGLFADYFETGTTSAWSVTVE